MSYLEAGFCKRKEYDKGAENPATELVVQEFYIVMFALDSRNPDSQAAKMPVRILNTEEPRSGVYKASLLLLNAELEPLTQKRAAVENGFWIDVTQQFAAINHHPIQESYFKQCGDEVEYGFTELLGDATADTPLMTR